MRSAFPLLLTIACAATDEGSADSAASTGPVPWSMVVPPLDQELGPVRGFQPRRTIIHLHSPWSHDACDGDPLPDGQPDPVCLADLREGLCSTAVDFAYLTDHPSTAAFQTWGDLFLAQPGDVLFDAAGQVTTDADSARALRLPCPGRGDGHEVVWMPGIEDELMPLGLERQAGVDAADNDRLYNATDDEAVQADDAAGAVVMVAHTEGRDVETLAALVPSGLQGVEMFNLHAMFDPDIREEDLGLDRLGWLAEIAPFTSEDGTAEPDLLYLGVHQEQAPSVAAWDTLQAEGDITGVAGTDAHRNSMPIELRDGERGDSYRRMMRWFSNILLVDGDATGAADADEALAAGRLFVAFELLGTPSGLDIYVTDDTGATWEMGSSAPPGILHVTCPAVSAASPHGLQEPEVFATVYRDGAPWQEGCGDFEVDGPHAYRVRIDIIPWHLIDFLGEDPDPWMQRYPWVYTNPIRVSP